LVALQGESARVKDLEKSGQERRAIYSWAINRSGQHKAPAAVAGALGCLLRLIFTVAGSLGCPLW
jgi:hypothetical protein